MPNECRQCKAALKPEAVVCPRCFSPVSLGPRSTVESALESDRRRLQEASATYFPCKVTASIAEKFEQLPATLARPFFGATQGSFRSASGTFVDGKLCLLAEVKTLDGSGLAQVVELPVKDIVEIRGSSLTLDSQIGSLIVRSLMIGGGVAIGWAVMTFVKSGSTAAVRDLAGRLVLLGVAVGLVFSFLPGLFSLQSELRSWQFLTADGRALPIALTPDQERHARPILEAQGLRITESATPA
jgi:hypothetical protein